MFRRYKFKGMDGSCGYRTGKVYWGQVEVMFDGYTRFVPLNPFRMIVPYSDQAAFYTNWSKV